jgi:ribose 5-phosphate isomerase RpiB
MWPEGKVDYGIVICGSGGTMTVNKHPKVELVCAGQNLLT